jgi:hypothetical protein
MRKTKNINSNERCVFHENMTENGFHKEFVLFETQNNNLERHFSEFEHSLTILIFLLKKSNHKVNLSKTIFTYFFFIFF